VLAFEPDQFFRRFAIWDGERRTGNDWKAFSRKCEAEGLEILTEKMHRKSKAMAEAATRDELCAAYLRGGQAEVTLVWWYEAPPGPDGEPGYRILCKGRPDVGADALVDLKTTKDGSPTEFGKSASRYLYTSQSAFYRHGYRTLTRKDLPCVLVAVESDEPHISQPYILTEAQLLRGESRFRTCLDQLHRCQQTNDWRGYADRPITLELPTWDAPEDDDGDLSALGLEGVEEAA
jgi:hypothetical protein